MIVATLFFIEFLRKAHTPSVHPQLLSSSSHSLILIRHSSHFFIVFTGISQVQY